ncbi:small heat shock protein, chloroplastic-like [Curcuma longa]|uniref:small heat shock protein, chloroplastic-like n=1 Tax=Curcuma longa TaxID=136217 RepID=UPI003D9E9E69
MSAFSSTISLSLPLVSFRGRANADHRLHRRGAVSVPRRSPADLSVKSMAGEGRDSLDHLQRASKIKQQQEPPQRGAAKRAVAPPSSPIGLWDRFPSARTVQQMMDTMERILEDPFAYGGASFPASSVDEFGGNYRRGRIPWEIKEEQSVYRMRFDMPGMTKHDVKVWVEEKMLVIKAEKLPKEGEEEAAADWSAKSYGRYNSRIALPENIDLGKIKAEVKDGVLYVTIPKASPSSKVMDISVQ